MRQGLIAKGKGHGVANAPAAIFFLGWRPAARGVVHPGCVVSETSGRREGACQFATHSHTFRSEMAGACRVRYEPPNNRSHTDCKCGSGLARAGIGSRSSCRYENTGGLRDVAMVCRPIAGTDQEIARTEAATPDENCQKARASAQSRDGTPSTIWLVRRQLLVRMPIRPGAINQDNGACAGAHRRGPVWIKSSFP
jgi:hypothetical protein